MDDANLCPTYDATAKPADATGSDSFSDKTSEYIDCTAIASQSVTMAV